LNAEWVGLLCIIIEIGVNYGDLSMK
jgi:hypothetical protein